MPIYEFHCEDCKKTYERIYLWRSSDGVNVVDEPFEECPVGHGVMEFVPSLATMRPDDLWHGHYMENVDLYTTSRSRYNKFLKDNDYVEIADMTDRESMTKIAAEANKEKDRRYDKELTNFLVDTWREEEFGHSHIVGEAEETREKMRRAVADCPNDQENPLCIDPAIAELCGSGEI